MSARSSLFALSLLFATACTGAASSELFDPATEQASTEPGAGAETGNGANGGSGAAEPSSSSSSSGGPSGGGGDKDAGAPPPPPPECLDEKEPNDAFNKANTFTSCITGKVKGRDVDYVQIVAPKNAAELAIDHSESGGKVAYRVFVDGVPYPAFTNDAPDALPATPGATYTVQIQPAGGTAGDRTWKLEVSFQ